MRGKHEILDAVIQALGGIEYEIEQGKHIKVRFYAHGRPQMVVVSRSTGEWHAAKNAVRDVRKILKGGDHPSRTTLATQERTVKC